MRNFLSFNKRVLFLLALIVLWSGSAVAQKKVAVVFGGGGAKGAAEIGVLKYIEKSGIHVDYVVGTSIGSIIGGMYAAGYNSAELDSMFRSQKWLSLMTSHSKKEKAASAEEKKERKQKEQEQKELEKEQKELEKEQKEIEKQLGQNEQAPGQKEQKLGQKEQEEEQEEEQKEARTKRIKRVRNNVKKFRQDRMKNFFVGMGLLKGDSITSLLDEMVYEKTGGHDFSNLKKPFRCMAVDVNRFQEVQLADSNVAQAMRCSMSIPLVFKAVKKDTMVLVDGGVLNNLPVDVARQMGADIVIAVDLAVNTHEEADSTMNDLDQTFKLHVNNGLLNMRQWKRKHPDIKRYRANVKDADIYIHPDLHGFSAKDFKRSKIEKMILLGEKAGQDALPQLEALRRKINVKAAKGKGHKK